MEQELNSVEPLYQYTEEEIEARKKEEKKKLWPKNLKDNVWRYFVYGFEKAEIYVIENFPTINDLRELNIPGKSIRRYVKHKNYQKCTGGRCKGFTVDNRNIIIVSIHEFADPIETVAIASHEFNHCAHRILDFQNNKDKSVLSNYEESQCTIQDWLLETYLRIKANKNDFSELYQRRDLSWFHVITHN